MNVPRTLDQHELDLINGAVDGELNAVEMEQLDKLLAESDAAREYKEELEMLATVIGDLPELESPHYLQESIERQIRLPVESEVAGQQQGIFGNWFSAKWLRSGVALAAGVVLTIAVYEMGSGPISEQDANNLVGTVVKNPAPAQTELLDKIFLTDHPVIGFIELHRSDELFTLDMLLSSDEPLEIVIDFGDRGLDFEDLTSVPRRLGAVTLDAGLLSILGEGEQHYTLKLKSDTEKGVHQAAPLELAFFVNDKLVQEAEVSISQH